MLRAQAEEVSSVSAAISHEERDPANVLLEGFHALETPEGFRAELIEGEIVVAPPPVGTHENDIAIIVQQVMRKATQDLFFSGNKGLILDRGGLCPRNRLIPDGVFVPAGAFKNKPSWMTVDDVLLVLEVTSSKADQDRKIKRYCYARGGVPLYLLIDRQEHTITLFSEPGGTADLIDYRQDARVPFGKPLELPEPLGFALDTSELD